MTDNRRYFELVWTTFSVVGGDSLTGETKYDKKRQKYAHILDLETDLRKMVCDENGFDIVELRVIHYIDGEVDECRDWTKIAIGGVASMIYRQNGHIPQAGKHPAFWGNPVLVDRLKFISEKYSTYVDRLHQILEGVDGPEDRICKRAIEKIMGV